MMRVVSRPLAVAEVLRLAPERVLNKNQANELTKDSEPVPGSGGGWDLRMFRQTEEKTGPALSRPFVAARATLELHETLCDGQPEPTNIALFV